MDILYFTKDLFFSSRVCSLAREAGRTIQVSSSIEAGFANRDTALVIIDLGLAELDITLAVPQLRDSFSDAKIVAYGPHVEAATLAAAEQAGCDVVLPRSQFDQQIAALLQGLPSSPR